MSDVGLQSLSTDDLVSVLRELHSFSTLPRVGSDRLAGADYSLWTPDGCFVHRDDLRTVSHGRTLPGMGLSAVDQVRFARRTARKSPWCAVEHRDIEWASCSSSARSSN